MSQVTEIKGDQYENEVLKSELPVLVDFWAPWCGPCQAMLPVLDDLAGETRDTLKIVKVNIDEIENAELVEKNAVQSVPTLKLFKNGEELASFVGAKSKEDLKKEIESFLNQ